MKKLMNLHGAKALNKKELKMVTGGWFRFYVDNTTCQDGSKVWMLEDEPTTAEWQAFITESC